MSSRFFLQPALVGLQIWHISCGHPIAVSCLNLNPYIKSEVLAGSPRPTYAALATVDSKDVVVDLYCREECLEQGVLQ